MYKLGLPAFKRWLDLENADGCIHTFSLPGRYIILSPLFPEFNVISFLIKLPTFDLTKEDNGHRERERKKVECIKR